MESKTDQLNAVNKWVAPFMNQTIAVIKAGMLDANRTARKKARAVLADARKVSRWVRKSYARTQEFLPSMLIDLPTGLDIIARNNNPSPEHQGAMLIAQAQELAEEGQAYADVAKLYGAWSDGLGNKLWERKVSAVKTTMTRGIEDGWSLRTTGHFVNKKNETVSSFEATGGKGGASNASSGYRYIVDNPGVLSEMSKNLQPYGVAGWEVERLARTEYTRAMNDGLRDVYEQDDSVVAYEWDTILDARTCPECAMLNGTVIEVGDPRLADYSPPIHAQGRCELLPVFVWELQESNFDKQRTVNLFDSKGKSFEVDYVASRINPDFLHPVRPANDAAGITRQFLSVAEAEALRSGFVATPPVEQFAAWIGVSADEAIELAEELN